MGFFGNLIGAAVKVAVTPIAVVKDVVDVTQGIIPDNTANLVDSAIDDVVDAFNDLTE